MRAKTSSRKQKGWEECDGPAVSAPPLQLFSKKMRKEAVEQQQQGAESQEQADTAIDAPPTLFSSSSSDPPGAEQREARVCVCVVYTECMYEFCMLVCVHMYDVCRYGYLSPKP
jgi:hypothetical protein